MKMHYEEILEHIKISFDELRKLAPGVCVDNIQQAMVIHGDTIARAKFDYENEVDDAIFKVTRRMINLYQQKLAFE